MSMKVAIIIPAYNEEKKIRETLRSINWPKKDIIVVDDGSTDKTFDIAKEEGVTVLRHNTNFGKGKAQRTGFAYAIRNNYDCVITMDADGQHSPAEIPNFIKAMSEGKGDIIIGTRKPSLKDMPPIRVLTNLLTSLVVSLLCGTRVRDSQSGYRIIKREVLEKTPLRTNNYQTESEIIINAGRRGYRIGAIPIKIIYRGDESSKIDPIIDTIRFIKLALWRLWV